MKQYRIYLEACFMAESQTEADHIGSLIMAEWLEILNRETTKQDGTSFSVEREPAKELRHAPDYHLEGFGEESGNEFAADGLYPSDWLN
jgi:hypothetical protein